MGQVIPFNPLDKKNLGASVAEALLNTGIFPLGSLTPFEGAGIYAIYYSGDFAPYRKLAERNRSYFDAPIYVGKAVPKGSRQGGDLEAAPGRVLYQRLKQHADSVAMASNLSLDHFYCRYLVVDDIWIPLGESLMIARFTPIWNSIIDGFGNHDPGGGRYAGRCPRWDVLHPGRKWALKLQDRGETFEDLAREATQYLENSAVGASDKFIEPK